MKDDLISKQAVVNRINKQREHLKPDIDERDAIGDAVYRVCAKFIKRLPSVQPEIIRCRDCKYFELNHFDKVNGIPLITAHEICTRWGDGCKTDSNGFCFLAES